MILNAHLAPLVRLKEITLMQFLFIHSELHIFNKQSNMLLY